MQHKYFYLGFFMSSIFWKRSHLSPDEIEGQTQEFMPILSFKPLLYNLNYLPQLYPGILEKKKKTFKGLARRLLAGESKDDAR